MLNINNLIGFGVGGEAKSVEFLGIASGTTSATLPAHKAGDLLVVVAVNPTSTTIPSLPAGWTSIQSGSRVSVAVRVGFRIATSDSETTGTWTNASSVIAAVYRNAAIGASAITNNASTTINWPALTLQVTDGSSWVSGGAVVIDAQAYSSVVPSGRMDRLRSEDAVLWDSNSGIASYAGETSTQAVAMDYVTVVFEIKLSV